MTKLKLLAWWLVFGAVTEAMARPPGGRGGGGMPASSYGPPSSVPYSSPVPAPAYIPPGSSYRSSGYPSDFGRGSRRNGGWEEAGGFESGWREVPSSGFSSPSFTSQISTGGGGRPVIPADQFFQFNQPQAEPNQFAQAGNPPARPRPEPRPNTVRFGSRTTGFDGDPVPTGAIGAVLIPNGKTWLYEGNSAWEPLGYKSPPHLAVRDFQDKPPTYPLENYQGLQSFDAFHGTSLIPQVIMSSSPAISATERDALRKQAEGLLKGQDATDFYLDSEGKLAARGLGMRIDFFYEAGGATRSFSAGARDNLNAMLEAHLKELLVTRREAPIRHAIGKFMGAQVPDTISSGQLRFPYPLKEYLSKSCLEAGLEAQIVRPNLISLSVKGTLLAQLRVGDGLPISLQCVGKMIVLEGESLVPAEIAKVFSTEQSNVIERREGEFRHADAIYAFREGKLIAGRRSPTGERMGVLNATQFIDGAGLEHVLVPLPGVAYRVDLCENGLVQKRFTGELAGQTSLSKDYGLIAIAEGRLGLSRFTKEGEVLVAELERPTQLQMNGTTLFVAANGLRPAKPLRVDLNQEVSDVRESGEFLRGSGTLALFVISQDTLTLGRSLEDTTRISAIEIKNDLAQIQLANQASTRLEVSVSGKAFQLRPTLDWPATCSAYRPAVGPKGSIEVLPAAGGASVARVFGLRRIACQDDTALIVADAIQSESLKGQVGPAQVDAALVGSVNLRLSLGVGAEEIGSLQATVLSKGETGFEIGSSGQNTVVTEVVASSGHLRRRHPGGLAKECEKDWILLESDDWEVVPKLRPQSALATSERPLLACSGTTLAVLAAGKDAPSENELTLLSSDGTTTPIESVVGLRWKEVTAQSNGFQATFVGVEGLHAKIQTSGIWVINPETTCRGYQFEVSPAGLRLVAKQQVLLTAGSVTSLACADDRIALAGSRIETSEAKTNSGQTSLVLIQQGQVNSVSEVSSDTQVRWREGRPGEGLVCEQIRTSNSDWLLATDLEGNQVYPKEIPLADCPDYRAQWRGSRRLSLFPAQPQDAKPILEFDSVLDVQCFQGGLAILSQGAVKEIDSEISTADFYSDPDPARSHLHLLREGRVVGRVGAPKGKPFSSMKVGASVQIWIAGETKYQLEASWNGGVTAGPMTPAPKSQEGSWISQVGAK